jgi:hypothetical protein
MNSSNPEDWKLPAGWQPLREGEWEFEQLRRFAVALLRRDPSFGVELDAFEDGYLKVDVSQRGSKIGEVFVNRDAGKQASAVFRLFVGHEGQEQNVGSVDEAIRRVQGAAGVWRDHPGAGV